MNAEPAPANAWLRDHVALLLRSYRRWTGRDLLNPLPLPGEAARAFYHAPLVVLSHGTGPDPRFTYANLAAQKLFDMPWDEIVGMPSRLSAEPVAREERQRLLDRVAVQGYIDDYSGVRITRSGRRFVIRNAMVWNLVDGQGAYAGQAACFREWEQLAERPSTEG